VDYEFVANALDKTEAAGRELVQRAKERLAEATMLATPPRYAPKRDEHSRVYSATAREVGSWASAVLRRCGTRPSDFGAARRTRTAALRGTGTRWALPERPRA
jgi:hypothetical protein